MQELTMLGLSDGAVAALGRYAPPAAVILLALLIGWYMPQLCDFYIYGRRARFRDSFLSLAEKAGKAIREYGRIPSPSEPEPYGPVGMWVREAKMSAESGYLSEDEVRAFADAVGEDPSNWAHMSSKRIEEKSTFPTGTGVRSGFALAYGAAAAVMCLAADPGYAAGALPFFAVFTLIAACDNAMELIPRELTWLSLLMVVSWRISTSAGFAFGDLFTVGVGLACMLLIAVIARLCGHRNGVGAGDVRMCLPAFLAMGGDSVMTGLFILFVVLSIRDLLGRSGTIVFLTKLRKIPFAPYILTITMACVTVAPLM